LIKCITDKKRLTNDWLFYFLSSQRIQQHIISLSDRSRQAGVSPTDLNKLLIPLPSIEIQKDIIARIREEGELVQNNFALIKLFQNKINDKTNEIWGE
jgi:restriction endonuclease S subunit